MGRKRKKKMCPLRFILVFFSALIAGYFAWRSFNNSPGIDPIQLNEDEKIPNSTPTPSKDDARTVRKVVQDGFWIFVDMASGKYLWRNLKEMNRDGKEKVKS